jgi:chitinase
MKVVRIFAALLVFSSALYAALGATTGPTSGMVIVNAGGANQGANNIVPAGSIGTIVAGPKTVNGVVEVNVLWNGSASFQANYNGWTPSASLSPYTGTTPTNPPPTNPPPTDPTPPATGMKIIGYYPRYAIEDGFYPKNLITNGSIARLTHINFAFANIVNNRCASFNTSDDYLTKVSASNSVNGTADGSFGGTFHQFQELKAKYPNLKIIVSIGGGSVSASTIAKAASSSNRAAFVQSCINMYIKGNFGNGITQAGIFDGFDIDWEFPASATDRSNFTGLLSEFRSQLDAVKSGYTLSIAGPNGQWAWQYIDLVTVQKYLN